MLVIPEDKIKPTTDSGYSTMIRRSSCVLDAFTGVHKASNSQTEFEHMVVAHQCIAPKPSRSTPTCEAQKKVNHKPNSSSSGCSIAENHTVVVLDDTNAKYQLGNCIGKGQFGAVYRALNVQTGEIVAIKRIRVEDIDVNQEMMQEVDLLKSMADPHIVQYIGFARDQHHLNIVLEYVENGSLLSTLKAFGSLPEKLVASYAQKVLHGLVYLHSHEVVHCDLKAANILTTKTGAVKLSDFGVSLNLRLKQAQTGPAGTSNWMAPEVIELKGASTKSDVWSLGCTIVELLTGKPPYSNLIAMSALYHIVEDDCPPLPDNISQPLQDFLRACFQKDPSDRPTAKELLRHPWLRHNRSNSDAALTSVLDSMTLSSPTESVENVEDELSEKETVDHQFVKTTFEKGFVIRSSEQQQVPKNASMREKTERHRRHKAALWVSRRGQKCTLIFQSSSYVRFSGRWRTTATCQKPKLSTRQ
ncbi:hypothetical protein EC973_004793 [Apophysomyces ossiformis]|uniref:Protein kinase domain-containing protein n=1 Tax=Apophysomyces ossiformis TaxID=679940 RepID=A0A8H7BUX0_9FUNG|nr:hypothetical protein EC973_004793 [Apophysomyces ossiformis]